MSTESLNRTSEDIETPSQNIKTDNVVELGVLKPRVNTFNSPVKFISTITIFYIQHKK